MLVTDCGSITSTCSDFKKEKKGYEKIMERKGKGFNRSPVFNNPFKSDWN